MENKDQNEIRTSGKALPCPLFWFPTKFTAACQAGSELCGSAIGDRGLMLMFCSHSKSEQPNSSDELVPQVLWTTYELIGCVGENSAVTVVIITNSIPLLYLSLYPSHNRQKHNPISFPVISWFYIVIHHMVLFITPKALWLWPWHW